MEKQTYNLTKEEVLEKFSASVDGLSEQEAKARLKQYGCNSVKKKATFSWFSLLFNQFNNALVWILIVAALLALGFHEYRDATILFLIVVINSAIGFFQEFRAEKTLENIRKLATSEAIVIREKKKVEIDARDVVPGDILFVSAGDTVAADGYILEGYDIYTDEFIFTGESKPGKKLIGTLPENDLPLSDQNNMVFMGSSLTRGEAHVLVTGTGMNTQLGHIANLVAEVKEEETPLQKQMRVLGFDVTVIALLLGALVLIAGHYKHMTLFDNFLFALALAVSVVPNGLPAAISVSLSLGMKRLLKDNVLAKKLNAVETLASVSIICTDKTDTITKNELMVTKIVIDQQTYDVSGDGYQPLGKFSCFGRNVENANVPNGEKICRIATLCNDAELAQRDGAWSVVGDPTEGALLVAAQKFSGSLETYAKGFSKLGENPFSSDRMRMSVIYKDENEGKAYSFVKGSPDVLLDMCTMVLRGDEILPMNDADRTVIRNMYNDMSSKALRVLAFTYRSLENVASEEYEKNAEQDLVWVGMMAMIDPPRKDVAEAIKECHTSGIKVIMITGDYAVTAEAIAKEVGLIRHSGYEIINGTMLNKLEDTAVVKKIKENDIVFARITPEQKLRIATLLKKSGAIIAMTGDGVNDAPALKRADIGVAMGKIGTDVAKEAADIILLDDNFASIVKVVKEGRTIYQNLRKIVYFAFVANASEFFTAALGVLLQVPAPITAIQILAIDLGVDVLPSFSLSVEPSEPTIMKRKPFNARHRIISKAGIWRLARIGIIIATGAVVGFYLSMKRGGWDFGGKFDANSLLYIKSTTVAYATLALGQMANLLQARSETLSVFKLGFFKNKFAILSVIFSVFMLLVFMYVPFFQNYLRMMPIMWKDWIVVIVTAIAVFIFEEARKTEDTKN